MNEQIRNMARQAGATDEQGDRAESLFCFTDQELDTFAEQLIRECSSVIFKSTGPRSALNILEHFGLDE